MQKGYFNLVMLIVGLIFVLIGLLVISGGLNQFSQNSLTSPTPNILPEPKKYDGWKKYKNELVGFEFEYPPEFAKPELPSGAPGSPQLYADGNEGSADLIFISQVSAFSLIFFPFIGNTDEFVKTKKNSPNHFPIITSFTPEDKIKETLFSGGIATWYGSTNKDGFNSREIYFTANNYAFILAFMKDMDNQTVEKIISTFQFTKNK